MRVRLAGETRTGRAIDLRKFGDAAASLSASEVADAVRSDAAIRSEDASPLAVECPDPCPVHERVGVISSGSALSLRPALAAAARTRGHTAPQAEELAAVRDRLDALDVPDIDLQRVRRRVADASDAEAELRERVAALRGRVAALRDADLGDDPETTALADAETELADATRRLSEFETERVAAEQVLDRARDRAAANRERRRDRLRLEDRAANLRRAAREHLADEVRGAFEEARGTVPSGVSESVSAMLAVVRVAELDAPVVVAREDVHFDSADETSRWLGTPILYA